MSVTVRTLEEIYDDLAVVSRDLAAARKRVRQAESDAFEGEKRRAALNAELGHYHGLQISLRVDRLQDAAS